MSVQRWYAVEAHRHGKGGWARRGPVHPSRLHARQWARSRKWLELGEAVNGSRQVVYRIVEVDAESARVPNHMIRSEEDR